MEMALVNNAFPRTDWQMKENVSILIYKISS